MATTIGKTAEVSVGGGGVAEPVPKDKPKLSSQKGESAEDSLRGSHEMPGWIVGLANFIGVALAAFLAEKWGIKHNRLTTRDYPLGRAQMRLKVWRALKLTALLVLLAEADFWSGIWFGREMLFWITPGSLAGALWGTHYTMWKRFEETESRLAKAAAAKARGEPEPVEAEDD